MRDYLRRTFSLHPIGSFSCDTHTQVLTLVTADAFEADAAVTGSRHVVTGGVVHTLTQLLAAVTKRPRWTLLKVTHTHTRTKT